MNGGFENNTCDPNTYQDTSFCPNSQYYHCDIANWICSGGGYNTYAFMLDTSLSSPSIIIEGIQAAYFGNWSCEACSASGTDTSCVSDMSCEVTGIPAGYPYNAYLGYGGSTGVSLKQTVNGLTLGATYVLEFWVGGESIGSNYTKNGLFALDVGFGNIFLIDPPTPPVSGIGIRYVVVFSAVSTSHTVKFTNWGHIGGSNTTHTELVLDDVQLFAANPDENICITAINDLSQNAIATVFPNPATNLLTITTTTSQPSEIILYDIASRKLMQQKFSGSAILNIENLAKGVYLYEVRDEKGVVKQGKVVKE